MKFFVPNEALMTGQRLESAVGVVQSSVICGNRVTGNSIDPG
jgi:hypothetical protein